MGADALAQLTIWQSFSFGVGLVLASPINGTLYAELVTSGADIEDPKFASKYWRMAQISALLLGALIILLVLIGRQLFGGGMALAILLAISLISQVVASSQRAIFSARGSWWRFSSQFIIEGVGRLVGTGAALSLFPNSLNALLVANVISQLGSVVLPVMGYKWIPGRQVMKASVRETVQLFLPLAVSALASQALLSLTPVFVRVLSNSKPTAIAALGGASQLMRIPVTFSSPLTLPFLNKIGGEIRFGFLDSVRDVIRAVNRRLILLWSLYGILIFFFYVFVGPSALTYANEITLPFIVLVVAGSVSLPLMIFQHSVQVLRKDSRTLLLSWTGTLLIYLLVLVLSRGSAKGSLCAIVLSAQFCRAQMSRVLNLLGSATQ